jgi:hypothetical protein
MVKTTLRVVFTAEDWHVASAQDIEEPLDEGLMAAGVGEIVSGGVGPAGVVYDIAADDPQSAIPVLRRLLRELDVPRSTLIGTPGGDLRVWE